MNKYVHTMREISEEFLTMTVAKAFANKAPKGFAEIKLYNNM